MIQVKDIHKSFGDLEVLKGVKDIGIVQLTHRDVVRHELVQAIVRAYEKHAQKAAAETIGKLLDGIELECRNLEKALAAPNAGKKILESMAALRKLVDMLEKRVDDDLWTLPKYREMLFIN